MGLRLPWYTPEVQISHYRSFPLLEHVVSSSNYSKLIYFVRTLGLQRNEQTSLYGQQYSSHGFYQHLEVSGTTSQLELITLFIDALPREPKNIQEYNALQSDKLLSLGATMGKNT